MENSVDSSKTWVETSNAETHGQGIEEGGGEIAPAATAEDTTKDQLVGGCDEEYCVYLTTDVSKEVTGLRDSVDEMLTRLDEFCGMLDMIRKDSSEILDQHVPYITMKTAEMKNVYAKIDKIEAFVQMVGTSAVFLEEELLQAEKEHRGLPKTVRKILQTFRAPAVLKKHESATRTPYELPVLFRTEEFFTAEPGSADMKKPNS
ncbi:biogenesis of lysosome-related organelles complex 1 subunit 4-like isoform X1 [Acipenser ruthenus]|uniref:biogenesis of lysosome-related organelles complex 1 subunit 4-like isoform X1 n=1 Tax=Acipenser ruthenus TaxID=7906 RepID=UPI00274229C5|nr:biogenesis of lysosome-related organelles complex 1 subunit 4-like isoform X1 [Acipenser ruthenus]